MTIAPPRQRRLVIHDLEWYREAIDFNDAHMVPHRDSLPRQINYLLCGHYWDADALHIAKDFPNHSFSFWFEKDGKQIGFNGGIILHGLQEYFAVTLNPPPGLSWSIHT